MLSTAQLVLQSHPYFAQLIATITVLTPAPQSIFWRILNNLFVQYFKQFLLIILPPIFYVVSSQKSAHYPYIHAAILVTDERSV